MVRVAIVGCSNLGRMHAKNYLQLPDAEVVAYCDLLDEPRAIMKKEVFDPAGVEPQAFDDFDRMVKDVQPDAVSLVLPHSLHYPFCMKCLNAGLHVLCEKPLVTETGHAVDLLAKAKETKRILEISFQSVYTANFQYMRDAIRKGDAGDIVYVHGHQYQGWLTNLAKKPEKKWRLKKDISGGGQLYDSGSHLLNGMLWATGLKPARVYAEIDNRTEEVDVCSSLSIRFDNGAVGSIAISGETWQPGMVSRLIITGTKLEFTLHHSGQDLKVYGPTGEVTPEVPENRTPQANFVNAILGKEEPLCPVEYGLTLAKFMDAVYESADQQKPVDIPV
ncbi:MAG: Gfo/Idh/MocA family oxidoreductase [Planctomycetes bacterium]|nr:Gfo/Idh/MocA family oxidoreductase [Planctomycetota bacterium]